MSQATRTQIDNMQAFTAANSITPNSLGVILEAIETELDGNDSSYTSTTIHERTKTLETTASNLSTRMTAAEGDVSTLQTTVATQGNSISTLQTTTSSSISSLQSSYSSHNTRIATLETKTSMGGSVYGGNNSIAPRTNAIPLYKDEIKTEDDYPLKVVKLASASSANIDFTQINLAKHEFLIDCQDTIDLTAKMTSASINQHQTMRLNAGNHYRLTILTVLDTTQHQSYSPSDVEYHAFLEQM